MACDTVVDSFTQFTGAFSSIMYDFFPSVSFPCAMGQTFTTPSSPSYRICEAKFKLKRIGNPTGNLQARLYDVTECDSFKPNGEENYLAASDKIDMSTITTDDNGEWYSFPFSVSQQYLMEINHIYAIVVVCIDAGSMSSVDGITMAENDDETLHSGNKVIHQNGAWECTEHEDVLFYVYGEICNPFFSINSEEFEDIEKFRRLL